MGSLLNKPITKKVIKTGIGKKCVFVSAEMQGKPL
jgi:hypothetical protein